MLRTTTEWTGFTGAPGYTTLHFDGLTAADATAAHSATAAFWQTLDQELWSGQQGTVLGDVPVIDPATGDITNMNTVAPVVITCTGSGDALPPTNQMLVRWRTGFYQAGREVRGRTFVPGLRETTVTAGTIPAGTVTGFETVLNAWLATLPAGRSLQVWSRTQGTATNVNLAQVWNQVAVLRSRRD